MAVRQNSTSHYFGYTWSIIRINMISVFFFGEYVQKVLPETFPCLVNFRQQAFVIRFRCFRVLQVKHTHETVVLGTGVGGINPGGIHKRTISEKLSVVKVSLRSLNAVGVKHKLLVILERKVLSI